MFKKILQYLRPKSLVQYIIENYIMIDGLILLAALIWGYFDRGSDPIGNLGALILIIVGQGSILIICLIILLIKILNNLFHKQSFLHEFLVFLTLFLTLVATLPFILYAYFLSILVLSILYYFNRMKTNEEQKYNRD